MSPLKTILLDEIAANGPMSLAAYMRRALADPQYGYYMQRRPFGTAAADGGDFITANCWALGWPIYGSAWGNQQLFVWQKSARDAAR